MMKKALIACFLASWLCIAAAQEEFYTNDEGERVYYEGVDRVGNPKNCLDKNGKPKKCDDINTPIDDPLWLGLLCAGAAVYFFHKRKQVS